MQCPAETCLWVQDYEKASYSFYDAVFDKGDEITAKVYVADFFSGGYDVAA